MPLTTEAGIQVPLTKNRNNRKLKNIDVPVEGIFLPFLFTRPLSGGIFFAVSLASHGTLQLCRDLREIGGEEKATTVYMR